MLPQRAGDDMQFTHCHPLAAVSRRRSVDSAAAANVRGAVYQYRSFGGKKKWQIDKFRLEKTKFRV